MKKTICLLLALVMALALFAVPVAAEEETVPTDPAEVPVEPVVTDTVADTPDTAPAESSEVPVEPTEAPADGTEIPAEPTETPVDDAESPAEPTTEPTAEPEVMAEPTAAPEGDETPAEEGVAPISEPPTTPSPTPWPGEDTSPHKNDYYWGVWLHVINGSFTADSKGVYTDKLGQASIWVDFKTDDAGNPTRKLPEDLPGAKRGNGTFKGWYTSSAREEIVFSEDGSYSYWKTTANPSGKMIRSAKGDINEDVPQDVWVLYAVFDNASDSGPADPKDQFLTIKFNYNGMFGQWGNVMTGLRSLSTQFTAASAKIANFNWNSECEEEYNKLVGERMDSWAALKQVWSTKTWNGYKFLGWSKEEHGKDSIIAADFPMTNGLVLYAQWEKGDGSSSEQFVRPTAQPVGPMTNLTYASAINQSTHATRDASIAVYLGTVPENSKANNLTWTLSFADGEGLAASMRLKHVDVTVEKPYVSEQFEAKVEGLSLVITNKDGQARGINVTARAESEAGQIVYVNGGPSYPNGVTGLVSFTHDVATWSVKKPATCTDEGEEEGYCSGCRANVTRKTSTLAHVFQFQVSQAATCTESGWEESTCLRCGKTYAEIYKTDRLMRAVPATGHSYNADGYCDICGGPCKLGDANGDGAVNSKDSLRLFKLLSAQNTTPIPLPAGDVNHDGEINSKDSLKLFKFLSNQIDSLD